MTTETQTGLSSYIRGMTATTLVRLAGTVVAMVSDAVVETSPEAVTSQLAVGTLGALILIQFPVLRVVGVDVNGFDVKDYLYMVFMTFAFWLITFTILLTLDVRL